MGLYPQAGFYIMKLQEASKLILTIFLFTYIHVQGNGSVFKSSGSNSFFNAGRVP